MLQLNVLNGQRRTRVRHAMNAVACQQVSVNGLFQDIGNWFNKAWNVSLNLDELFSDMYNFHLEVFDGIQRQWTGVDLIKTEFSSPWIKDAADKLTGYSHIGGLIILTYFFPAVTPILIAGGKMIGTAIRAQDTRYIEYMQKMREFANTNLTPKQEMELISIIVWALVNIKFQQQPGGGEIKKEFEKIRTGSKEWTVKEMFNRFKQWGYDTKVYLKPNAMENVNFADVFKSLEDMRWNILCMPSGSTYTKLFPVDEAKLWAYRIMVADKTMTDAYNYLVSIRNKEKTLVNSYCNINRKGYNSSSYSNPWVGYIDPNAQLVATVSTIDPILSSNPVDTGSLGTGSLGYSGVGNPMVDPDNLPVLPGDSGTGTTTNTSTTDTTTTNNPASTTKTASMGPLAIGLGIVLLLSQIKTTKNTRKRK